MALERFGAATIDRVDLDPDMIGRASHRLAHYGDRVRLAPGNATDLRDAIGADDNSYDAVSILHHPPHPQLPRCERRVGAGL
ncbi:MAG: class I SAM-dependent methyltransferase [Actinomycetia bacterium]|nr:class I SAM-dependent methyltransferase [Actinomycetes bacterium]